MSASTQERGSAATAGSGKDKADKDRDKAGGNPAEATAEESEGGFKRAVFTGVRDAFAPVPRFLDRLGEHIILAVRALSWLPRRPLRLANYLDAAEYIGFGSLPIILLVGLFTGAVMALQSVFAFRDFGLESMVGGVTGKALATELAPVLAALMLTGRAAAGIATELGTMRISEQIDALESMAVNPIQFLVLPRLVAGFFMAPILTLIFFVIGMGGAYFVSVISEGVDHGQFVHNTKDILNFVDVLQGILKSAVFGFVVVLIGCYQGFFASGGGRGVGLGTTRAVVIGSVTVLITDYFLSILLLSILPGVSGGGG